MLPKDATPIEANTKQRYMINPPVTPDKPCFELVFELSEESWRDFNGRPDLVVSAGSSGNVENLGSIRKVSCLILQHDFPLPFLA